jgi:hypothetical protein
MARYCSTGVATLPRAGDRRTAVATGPLSAVNSKGLFRRRAPRPRARPLSRPDANIFIF